MIDTWFNEMNIVDIISYENWCWYSFQYLDKAKRQRIIDYNTKHYSQSYLTNKVLLFLLLSNLHNVFFSNKNTTEAKKMSVSYSELIFSWPKIKMNVEKKILSFGEFLERKVNRSAKGHLFFWQILNSRE